MTRLHATYVANNSRNDLLAISSGDGHNWSGDSITNHQSPLAPALTSFNGQLWMAYVANNSSNDLLVISSRDGHIWSGDSITNHQSPLAPALTTL
ncbi:MAG: hypothetical protein WCF33_06645 [Pseudonocardiaceae bacterium]